MHIQALYFALLFLSLLFAGTLYTQSPRLSFPRDSVSYTARSPVSSSTCIYFGATYEYGDVVDIPCGAVSQSVSEIYRYDNGTLYLVTRRFDGGNNNDTVITLTAFATGISLPDLYGSRFIRLGGGERYVAVRSVGLDNMYHYTMYYNEEPVSEIDPQTFSLVGVHDLEGGKDISDGTRPIAYSKDKNNVYYKAKPIPGADPETFVFVPSGDYQQEYGKDKNQAYYLNSALQKSDPSTFRPLGTQPYEGSGIGPYAIDKNNAYFKNFLISEADVQTFKAIIEGYAKDDNHVYKDGVVLPGADPKTFVFPEPGIG